MTQLALPPEIIWLVNVLSRTKVEADAFLNVLIRGSGEVQHGAWRMEYRKWNAR